MSVRGAAARRADARTVASWRTEGISAVTPPWAMPLTVATICYFVGSDSSDSSWSAFLATRRRTPNQPATSMTASSGMR